MVLPRADNGRVTRKSRDGGAAVTTLTDLCLGDVAARRHAVERIAVLEPRHTALEHMVDRALSFAKAWQGRDSSRLDDLANDVRTVLAPCVVDGSINEILEGTALIARRPAEI